MTDSNPMTSQQEAVVPPEAEPPSSPLLGARVGDKYEVESVLGAGGMGTVFAARHTLSGRRVALKTLDGPPDASSDVDRFLREAQAMGRIEHPNVVAVLDAGVHHGAPFLVMELLSGDSLRALIAREGAMSPERAIALLMPALEGVEAAHRAGVVHRDLKPENLFVCRERYGTQTTKVLDFGISKLNDRNVGSETRTGTVMGTPYYMSPEQARGLPVDARADVWSLGVILYEMIAGRVPFGGDNLGAILLAIATDEPPPLQLLVPSLPAALCRVVHRALAKERDARWSSVGHFAVALARHAPGMSFREPIRVSERPPAVSSPGQRTRAPLDERPGGSDVSAAREAPTVARRVASTAAARPHDDTPSRGQPSSDVQSSADDAPTDVAADAAPTDVVPQRSRVPWLVALAGSALLVGLAVASTLDAPSRDGTVAPPRPSRVPVTEPERPAPPPPARPAASPSVPSPPSAPPVIETAVDTITAMPINERAPDAIGAAPRRAAARAHRVLPGSPTGVERERALGRTGSLDTGEF